MFQLQQAFSVAFEHEQKTSTSFWHALVVAKELLLTGYVLMGISLAFVGFLTAHQTHKVTTQS